jgi:hypothetical protein
VGLFVGGQDLDGEGQRYLYLLVRADGRYVVKKRDGSSAEELSGGWKISEAVRVAAMEDGDVTNELSISVEGDIVSFWCNGERVEEMPVGDLSVHGVVGFRVNHNLSVNIQGFRVER